MATHHRVSEFLKDRWPVLPEVREDGSKAISVAYGDRGITKLHERIISGEISDSDTVECFKLLTAECVRLETCVQAANAGLLDACIYAAQSTNRDIRLASLCLAARIVTCEKGRMLLSEMESGLPSLMNICVKDAEPDVRASAADTVAAYLQYADGRTAILEKHAHAIPNLVEALAVTPHCFPAVLWLVSGDGRSVTHLLNGKLMAMLTRTLNGGDSASSKQCLEILRTILQHPQSQTEALTCNTYAAVPAYLSTEDDDLLLSALECLSFMSVPPEGKYALLQSDNSLPQSGSSLLLTIVSKLKHADKRVQHVAVDLLRSLSEAPAGKVAIVPLLVSDGATCIRVYGDGACDTLVALTQDARATVAADALAVLEMLHIQAADKPTFRGKILSFLNAKETLQTIANGCFAAAGVSSSSQAKHAASLLLGV